MFLDCDARFFVLVVLLNSFEIVARGGIIISHWEAGMGRVGALNRKLRFWLGKANI